MKESFHLNSHSGGPFTHHPPPRRLDGELQNKTLELELADEGIEWKIVPLLTLPDDVIMVPLGAISDRTQSRWAWWALGWSSPPARGRQSAPNNKTQCKNGTFTQKREELLINISNI